MQDVPKIVVKRLQSPAADSHPDADLLTAFAEQSLAGRERDSVMEHLSRCGDCREVVALALPAAEEVAPAGVSGSPARGWFSLPVLRWGVVAAGIIAVASVGFLQFRERRADKMVSTSLMARNQVADTVTPNPTRSLQASGPQTAPPPVEMGKQTEMRKKVAARAESAPALDKAAPPAHTTFPQSRAYHGSISGGMFGGSAGATVGGPIQRSAPSGGAFAWSAPPAPEPAATAKQNAAPGSASEMVAVNGATTTVQTTVEVTAAAPLIATESTAQNQPQDHLTQNQQAQLPLHGRNEAVLRAKPPAAEQSALSMAPAPALRADPSLMKSAGTPLWNISSTGTLQRSLDSGKTWQDVNVAANSSMGSNLMVYAQNQVVEVQSAPRTAKKSNADAKAKSNASSANSADAAPAPPTIFRALSVSSNAAEVWAGGSGGALYHSPDGGKVWVRLVPAAAGTILTGDIVSVQFSDRLHGTVTTSTAEVWTTADAGQTWRKQQ